MSAISHVHARQILDSRGNPTVEVEVSLTSGAWRARRCPSGASTGVHEAVELRDGGAACGGKGVAQAVANVNGEIADGDRAAWTPRDQEALDRRADRRSTAPRTRAASARTRSSACRSRPRRPRRPGGRRAALPPPRRRRRARAAGADDERHQRRRARRQLVDLQEFMVVPVGARSFAEALRMGAEIYHALKALLHERGPGDGGRRRGRLRAQPRRRTRRRSRRSSRRSAAPATRGEEVAIALDPAVERVLPRRRLPLGEGRVARAGRVGRATVRTSSTATRSSRSRTAWPRTTGTAGRRSTDRARRRLQLVGDDIFVTNPSGCSQGIERGVAQLDPDQGQPDRHAHRDARRDRLAHAPATAP